MIWTTLSVEIKTLVAAASLEIIVIGSYQIVLMAKHS